MKTIRIATCQLNFCVGDISGNKKKIINFIKKARANRADIVCFPELSITGYPPEDLLLNGSFIEQNIKALDEITKHTKSIIVIVGFADRRNGLLNAAAIMSNGKLLDIYHKRHLPNYGVFDEKDISKKLQERRYMNWIR